MMKKTNTIVVKARTWDLLPNPFKKLCSHEKPINALSAWGNQLS